MSERPITQEDINQFLRDIETARALLFRQNSEKNILALAQKQGVAAEAFLLSGDTEESRRYFAYALDTLEQVVNFEIKIDFLVRIGKVYSRAGKFSDASGYFLTAVKIRESLPQDTPEQRTELERLYQTCASVLLKTRRVDDAVALLSRSRDMLKKAYERDKNLSELLGWANALYHLGSAYSHYEAYDAALKLYDEAVSLYNTAERDYKADARREIANCLINIGGIYELNKDYESALAEFEKALEINRRLAVRDGDEPSLKHLSASCTHTAELYEMMGRLVDALALFREKADINLRLSRLKPVIEPPEILFFSPPEDFFHRLERLESGLPWYSLLFEMDNPNHDKLYISYFSMGRLIEELAKKNNDPGLFMEALKLFEASEMILSMLTEEFPENVKEERLREIKSIVRRIHSHITQGGNHHE